MKLRDIINRAIQILGLENEVSVTEESPRLTKLSIAPT